MASDDLPGWLPGWCRDHLGGEPAGVLFRVESISVVFGLRLAGGRDVVVKARADDGRAGSCVAAQAWLAERGFPCAGPLTPVTGADSLAVHAEEFRPGGEVLCGDSPDVAVRYAEVFAWLMAGLAGVPGGKLCTARARGAVMRSGPKQPNASAGLTHSTRTSAPC